MKRVSTPSEFGFLRSARVPLCLATVLLGGLSLPCGAVEPAADPSTGSTPLDSEIPQLQPAEQIALLERWLRKTTVSNDLRDAIHGRLQEFPQARSWSGQSGRRLFGMAMRPLPGSDTCERTVPAMLRLTRAMAVQELVLCKAISDRFSQLGLTDAAALDEALSQDVVGKVTVAGRIRGMEHLTAAEGQFAMALVVADEAAVAAEVVTPQKINDVRDAYRDVLHARIHRLIEQHDWQQAILIWDHLSSLELITPSLCLDAAYCCSRIEKDDVSVRILNQMIERFSTTAHAEDFEAAGDLALELVCELAEQLATRAYTMASDRLLHQIIPPKP